MSMLTRLRQRFPVLTLPATRREGRVAIARDVIENLDTGRMTVHSEKGYHTLTAWTAATFGEYEGTALAVRYKSRTKCEVCAIGAACLSAVGLYNDAQILENGTHASKGPDDDTMREVLCRWFSRTQLDLIESAFERGTFGWTAKDDERTLAIQFGKRYEEADARLRAIMGNIIRNQGTFKP